MGVGNVQGMGFGNRRLDDHGQRWQRLRHGRDGLLPHPTGADSHHLSACGPRKEHTPCRSRALRADFECDALVAQAADQAAGAIAFAEDDFQQLARALQGPPVVPSALTTGLSRPGTLSWMGTLRTRRPAPGNLATRTEEPPPSRLSASTAPSSFNICFISS